jgi:hypothetical protein
MSTLPVNIERISPSTAQTPLTGAFRGRKFHRGYRYLRLQGNLFQVVATPPRVG